MGVLARLKAANPALRVVLTGCSVRADNDGRTCAPLPGGRPVPATRPGARADRPPRSRWRHGARRRWRTASFARVGRSRGRRPPTACRRRAPPRSPRDASRAAAGTHAWLPDHLRLRQDLHLLHRAVQPRTGAQPAVRRRGRRGARPRGRRATARSRCSARTSTPTATTCRPSRASPDVHAARHLGRRPAARRPAGHRGAAARHRRPPRRRRTGRSSRACAS